MSEVDNLEWLENIDSCFAEAMLVAISETNRSDKTIVEYGEFWACARHKVQSPIEAKMAAWLGYFTIANRHGRWRRLSHLGIGLNLECQAQIGPYRVDFLLTAAFGEHTRRVVVECDGHDFHERNKEQAARDRRMDRFLQADGFVVFRFTGSEIYNDIGGVAVQILDFIEKEAAGRK